MAIPVGMGIFGSYLEGQEAARRERLAGLSALSTAAGVGGQLQAQQQAAQMGPLQMQILQAQLNNINRQAALRDQIMTGMGRGGPATPGQALTQGAAVGDLGPTVSNAARIGQVAPGAPGGGGGAGLSTPEQLMLLSGDPGMKALAEAQIGQRKPVATREGGGVYVPGMGWMLRPQPKTEAGVGYDPGTGTASPVPGYAAAVGGIEGARAGARAAAEAPYQPPIQTVGPNGEPIYTPRPAYAAPWLGGGQPGPRAAPGPAAPSPMPGPRPAPGFSAVGPSPATQAGDVETARERAGSGVKYETTILEGGQKARGTLTSLQVLAPNLEKLPTGPLYPTLVNAASYFSQFGIDVPALGQTLGTAQATDAVLKQFALKLRNPAGGEGMPGQMSDQDRKYLADAVPGLGKLKDGNRELIKILMTLEQRKIDEADIVSKMQADKKSTADIRAALAQFANSRPMFAR